MQRNAELHEAALVLARSELRGAAGTEQATVTERGNRIRALEADAHQANGWKDQQIANMEQSAYARDLAMKEELRQMEESVRQSASASVPKREFDGQVQSDRHEHKEAQRLADELAKAQLLATADAEHRAKMKREADEHKQ